MSVSDGRKSSSRESELDSEEEWQPEIVDDDERPFIPMSFGTEALTNWLTHAPIKRARYGDFSSIAKRRQVLSAASAAGISVAFGAPIGGVLFSLEEISYYFPAETMWKSFFCASVAAITLKFFDPFRNGKLVPFQVVYDRTWHPFELVFFILIGIIGGLVGTFLTSAIIRLGKYRQNSFLKNLGRAEVIAVTTATIIISYTNPFLRDDLVTLVSNLFNECKNSDIDGVCDVERYHGNVISLLLASFVRIFLAIMACGLAVPAGIFMPSMGIGAGIGRAIGMIVQHWHITNPQAAIFSSCPADVVCVTPGVYALVGAAALLASTTRMTATVVVVMFELTGALIYVLPIMVAVMVSKWTRDSLTNESIFEGVIRLNGYPYLSMHNDEHIPGSVNEIMTIAEDLLIIHGNGCTFGKLREILGSCDYQGLPVVESPLSMKLLGYISTPDLRLAIEQALDSGEFDNDTICYFGGHVPIDEDDSIRATKSWLDMRPWMDQTPIVVNTTEPLNLVAERFKHLGIRYVLITYQGALSGLVTKKDMIREPTRNHRQLPNDSISLRTLFFRNMSSEDYAYLEPGFDVNTLRVAEIRSILLTHGVEFNMSAKKSELLKVMDENIIKKAKAIRRELGVGKKQEGSSKGIEKVKLKKSSSVSEHKAKKDDKTIPPSAIPRTPRKPSRKTQALTRTDGSKNESEEESLGDDKKLVRKPQTPRSSRRSRVAASKVNRSDSEDGLSSAASKSQALHKRAVKQASEARTKAGESSAASNDEMEVDEKSAPKSAKRRLGRPSKRESTSSPASSPKRASSSSAAKEQPSTPTTGRGRKRKLPTQITTDTDKDDEDEDELPPSPTSRISKAHVELLKQGSASPSKKKQKELATPERTTNDLHFRRQTGNFSNHNPFQSGSPGGSSRKRARKTDTSAEAKPTVTSPLARNKTSQSPMKKSRISTITHTEAEAEKKKKEKESKLPPRVMEMESVTIDRSNDTLEATAQRRPAPPPSQAAGPRETTNKPREKSALSGLKSPEPRRQSHQPLFSNVLSPGTSRGAGGRSEEKFTMTPTALRELHAVRSVRKDTMAIAADESVSGLSSSDSSQIIRRRPGLPDFSSQQQQQRSERSRLMETQRQRIATLRKQNSVLTGSSKMDSKPSQHLGKRKRTENEPSGQHGGKFLVNLIVITLSMYACFLWRQQQKAFDIGFTEMRSGVPANKPAHVVNRQQADNDILSGPFTFEVKDWDMDRVVNTLGALRRKYVDPEGLHCPKHATCVPFTSVPLVKTEESDRRQLIFRPQHSAESAGKAIAPAPVMTCDDGYIMRYPTFNTKFYPALPKCVRDISAQVRVQGMADAIIEECQLHRGKMECERTLMTQVRELAQHHLIGKWGSNSSGPTSSGGDASGDDENENEEYDDAEELDFEEIEQLGLSQKVLHDILWDRAGHRLGELEFNRLFEQALELVTKVSGAEIVHYVLDEEDEGEGEGGDQDDESGSRENTSSAQHYLVANSPHHPLMCRIRRSVLTSVLKNLHWVGAGTVLLVLGMILRRRLATARAERKAADALVVIAIQRLADQACKHYLDPVLYPSAAISSNQLRDLLLMSPSQSSSETSSETSSSAPDGALFSPLSQGSDSALAGSGDRYGSTIPSHIYFFDPRVRQRVWERVRYIVEHNTNVRSRTMAIKGELMRTWEWIGPLDTISTPAGATTTANFATQQRQRLEDNETTGSLDTLDITAEVEDTTATFTTASNAGNKSSSLYPNINMDV
ncbi:hypothetical protein H4219_003287 [Mycoemilia scoparia]|uniref:Chloride channel protein n=1 Tax=Mycoemilia scoparia TaxID=417184 RepID=A0A9W8A117_9FUNG|nr:hypothetical protein H4219_003287 [Mycoemilia scoparia]